MTESTNSTAEQLPCLLAVGLCAQLVGWGECVCVQEGVLVCNRRANVWEHMEVYLGKRVGIRMWKQVQGMVTLHSPRWHGLCVPMCALCIHRACM
jgi:hypothetical protein